MRALIRFGCVALLLVLASTAVAQEEAPDPPAQQPAYCENNPGFDQWDFWVGKWKVYSNDDKRELAGTNTVAKHYANCLITETWVDTTGNGGFSINYYNPVRGRWRQVWVANGYSIDYTGGLNDQGEMVLEGEIDAYRPGTSTPFRGIWTPQDNGDVVQRFEIWSAESNEWTVWFEGLYVKQ